MVAGARAAFGLPYRWARMRHWHVSTLVEELHVYDARLRRPGSRPTSHIVVRVGGPRASNPLDEFLSARWGLHTHHLGADLFVPNQHAPWRLRHAEVVALDDQLMGSVGLGHLAARRPDQVAFSDGVRTEFGFPRRTSGEQTVAQGGGQGR